MTRFILTRLGNMVPLLLGICFLSFFIVKLMPGDYLTQLSQDPHVSQTMIARMRAEYGLNKPWLVQFGVWLSNAVRLRFGYSIEYHVPVSSLIGSRLWNTFILAFASSVLSWLLAIPLGIIAAVRRNGALDRCFSLFAFAGISLPTFFLAILAMLFAYATGWFPIGGMHSPDAEFMGPWPRLIDVLRHLALPTFVLGVSGCAGLLRQMRGNLLDTLRENFVMAARARGLAERVVVFKHATRNAINPMVTLFGYTLSGLLSGSALVEQVMAWPGLGRLILDAVFARDLYLVMGAFVMGTVLLLVGNLVGDLLLAVADPRIRFGAVS